MIYLYVNLITQTILCQSNDNGVALFFGLLVISGLLYLFYLDHAATTRKMRRAKYPDISVLERHKPVLTYLLQAARDVRVLKSTESRADLVGYLNDHKLYIALHDVIFPKPSLLVILSVVTPNETRKKRLVYPEPTDDLDVWDDIKVETEKLIDNV